MDIIIIICNMFGIEVTVLNYFINYFQFNFATNNKIAGIIAFSFGTLNIFARGFGGYLSDMLYIFHMIFKVEYIVYF